VFRFFYGRLIVAFRNEHLGGRMSLFTHRGISYETVTDELLGVIMPQLEAMMEELAAQLIPVSRAGAKTFDGGEHEELVRAMPAPPEETALDVQDGSSRSGKKGGKAKAPKAAAELPGPQLFSIAVQADLELVPLSPELDLVKAQACYDYFTKLVRKFGEGFDKTKHWKSGKGLGALVNFYRQLQNDIAREEALIQAPAALQDVLMEFLDKRKYIVAFDDMINMICQLSKIYFICDDFEGKIAGLLVQDDREITVGNLYFEFYGMIKTSLLGNHVALSAANKLVSEYLARFITQADGIKYLTFSREYPCIHNGTDIRELAHHLFLHQLLNLLPDYYSKEKRELLSALCDYVVDRLRKDPGSENITLAKELIFLILRSPHRPLADIFSREFSRGRVEGKQGYGQGLRSAVNVWVHNREEEAQADGSGLGIGLLHLVGKAAAATVSAVTKEGTFAPLLGYYRTAKEAAPSENICAELTEVRTEEVVVNEFLANNIRPMFTLMQRRGVLELYGITDADLRRELTYKAPPELETRAENLVALS
jgi:hypothetical protein